MTNTKVVKDLSPEKRALLAQLVKEEGGSHSRRRVVPGMSQVGVHSLSSLSGWSRDHNDLYYSGLFGWRSKEMCREGAIVGSSMSPVFIIAHPRSGSTLLQLILDTHPEIAGPGELGVGQLCHDLCRTVNLTIGRTSGASNELERGSAIIAKVRQILSDLMSSYVAGKGKQIWCDKLHMLYTDIVRVLFPQARYICLYRHCMDVVQSCARSIRSSKVGLVEVRAFVLKHLGDVVAAALDSWCEYVSKQLIFERENDANCFRVTYESLVSNPSETLGPLFAFLGVEWDPDLLDSVFAVPHDPGPGDPAARFSRRIPLICCGSMKPAEPTCCL